MDDLSIYHLERGIRMQKVEAEAKELLKEYAEVLETSKPEIKSNLNEFALEEAGIELTNVVIWDQGTIDVEFGKFVGEDPCSISRFFSL